MFKRCPYCNSIWVCWNWFNAWGGDFEKYCKANPFQDKEKLRNSMWGHECWICSNVIDTAEKVKNGIPYKLLRLYGFIKYRILR